MPKLDPNKILEIFKPNGLLIRNIKGFESREAQQKMLAAVLSAYNEQSIALIEAGTGTGKSLAYLIPAILWAVENKEPTVISTNTINLQEQLLHKDIPSLIKALNVNIKAVLVKGMNNYICLRKYNEAKDEVRFFSLQETIEFEKIGMCLSTMKDGSRSDLSFIPSGSIWEKVGAETDTCTGNRCPNYQECYFFKARRKSMDAQILIVNHHLLFSDLSRRAEENNYAGQSILPPYSRIILDEAHNIEDIATEFFSNQTSLLKIMRILSRLGGEKQGKLQSLKDKLSKHFSNFSSEELISIHTRLNIDLPNLRRDLGQQVTTLFQEFNHFIEVVLQNQKQEDNNKLRIIPTHKSRQEWTDSIIPMTSKVSELITKYIQSISSVIKDISKISGEKFEESSKSLMFEINALINRLVATYNTLTNFTSPTEVQGKVNWIESEKFRNSINTTLISADIDVSKKLVDFLFSKFPTIVLCSATLSTDKKFDFIKNRLGLSEEFSTEVKITQDLLESPFDYKKQALLAIPTDMPDPLHPNFNVAASEKIWGILQASKGNAFILFTSYTMLKICHQLLSKRLEENRFNVFKQGDDNRQSLLQKFKNSQKAVLFGTDSFWEGVDVVGEALRCVIITKLPFKVPTEPIIQARSEAIQIKGGNPFLEYSLPQAIVKFKQGFGRLIRNKNDRGCVVCLDNRLINKSYGPKFLNSLPDCQQIFSESTEVDAQIQVFYKKTYYLTMGTAKDKG